MLPEWTHHELQFGESTIEYALTYASRKTLGISVHPDLQVTVKAPEGSEFERIEQKVRRRASWILRQQRQFEKYLPTLPPREYVSGENHRYLGRQYRLKVVEDGVESVKLIRRYIYIYVQDKTDRERVKKLLYAWYREEAKRIFRDRLDTCFMRVQRLGIPYPELIIRAMRSRWGSCTPSGKVLLNVKLIQVPKVYIDYIITHELCHLKEHNHSKTYYALLDTVMPNWRQTRRKLNEFEFG